MKKLFSSILLILAITLGIACEHRAYHDDHDRHHDGDRHDDRDRDK